MGTVQNRLGAYVESSGREKAQVIQRHTESLRTSCTLLRPPFAFQENQQWMSVDEYTHRTRQLYRKDSACLEG